MEAVHLDSEMTQIGPQLPVIGHWPRNVFRLNKGTVVWLNCRD